MIKNTSAHAAEVLLLPVLPGQQSNGGAKKGFSLGAARQKRFKNGTLVIANDPCWMSSDTVRAPVVRLMQPSCNARPSDLSQV